MIPIDERALIQSVTELIEVRSDRGEESEAQRRMADWMNEFGLEVDCWDIDFASLCRHPAYTVEIERNEGLGLVGTLSGEGGPSLILNGHIDVVPPGERKTWSETGPWEGSERNGRLYGRGACDMKAGLLAGLFAMKACRDAGVRPAGDVHLWSVIGEEDGGAGTLATIERGHRADAAVIMEPTRLAVIPSQAGALSFRITVPGMSAHGALRGEGVDAIEKFYPILTALRTLEAERNRNVSDPMFESFDLPFALSIGTVRAGNWPSSVAESLVCEGRYGIATDENSKEAVVQFENAIALAARADAWLRAHAPIVEWWGARFEPARTDTEHPLIGVLSDALRAQTGDPTVVHGAPYGADMRLLVREAGIPTVMFGPGDIRVAHGPDEYVEIREVITACRALTQLIVRGF